MTVYRDPGPVRMSLAIITLTVLDLVVTIIEDARAWLLGSASE